MLKQAQQAERVDDVRAIELYSQAISENADEADVFLRRGDAQMRLGHLDDALADYERAIDLDRENHQAHLHRGHALQQLGRYDDAINAYTILIDIDDQVLEAFYAPWEGASREQDLFSEH